jgi:aspartyl-tRNA(Asn)/glutamyl-tRNA(Gln) amidotransferase subunit C
MPLDPALIDHLAQLARLALDGTEKPRLLDDLGRTLAMIDALQRIEVAGVEALDQPHGLPPRLREDVVTEDDRSRELLALSGDTHAGYFLVPRVIE